MRSCGTAEDAGAPTVASAGYEAVIRAADAGDPRYLRTAQGDILLVATGKFLRTSPRPGPPVRAWHGVIPRLADRAALQADAIALLKPRAGGPVGEDRTFWLDYFQGHSTRMHEEVRRTRCSLERLALDVLEFHTRADGSVEGGHRVRGVEQRAMWKASPVRRASAAQAADSLPKAGRGSGQRTLEHGLAPEE
jgi:hypothetical protein